MPDNFLEVVISQGEDIKKAIERYLLLQQENKFYIIGAVGSVIDMVFTTPAQNHLPLRCLKMPVYGAAEIIQFCGEVMPIEDMDPALAAIYPDKDGPLFIHIHAACATAGGHVTGGGLSAGKAFRSLRVFMVPLH